jgi:chromate transport protein ChrA
VTTLAWDTFLQQKVGKLRAKWKRSKSKEGTAEEDIAAESIALEERPKEPSKDAVQRRSQAATSKDRISIEEAGPSSASVQIPSQSDVRLTEDTALVADTTTHGIRVKQGLAIIAAFFGKYPHLLLPICTDRFTVSFIVIMVLRGTLSNTPLAYDLFSNMYLAGTIIFGGGPVVIPLLRAYVVEPGWVSPRDFLLGLAIIQALPGPNFNFGIYLGALALGPTRIPTIVGALIGFTIFLPGLTLAVGVQSLWSIARNKPWVISILRGVNATAVGLVFTAVYRLWEIGYLTPERSSGKSLASEPWWVVVATITYAQSAWFGVPPAVAILMGAILGLGWYGAVGS